MECSELTALVVGDLTGETNEEARERLSRHLSSCAQCREEKTRIESAWRLLGQDADAPVTSDFRRASLALIEDEMIRRRVRSFRPRPRWAIPLAYAAGLAVAAAGGAFVARQAGKTPAPAGTATAAANEQTSTTALPNLESGARLANVSYSAPDAQGRIGVSFDMESRRTVVGKPGDPELAKLLAYLVSRSTQTSGERSQAIEQVSSTYASRTVPASPEIVRALTSTLKRDPNPGVRKKAADALAAFPATPEIRAAFLEALSADRNPAVRLVAVEALAAAAKESPDPRTIESLREKAVDPAENGFVRAKAASALKGMEF
ncbi:MAG TPA: HEAT repeat domain-containing protein [Thermoanaerobaculia bacterium]|nr:HEAT repeat domain-containing protein [Thermoanaerobaculia bacterium]